MAIKKEKSFLLKDFLFNEEKVRFLAASFKKVYPEFSEKTFVTECVSSFPSLELKERMYHIRDVLQRHLPQDYKKAVAIICAALPEELSLEKSDDDFGDFIYAPLGEYIARYGKEKEFYDTSLEALYHITKRFSVEFPMRHFLGAYPEKTVKILTKWSRDKNYHIRRLASEALRPRLPWGIKIPLPYDVGLPVLHTLYTDKTRYVTRSVANHLHDISKENLPLVLETLSSWKKEGKQSEKELDFIIKHALRTALKQGNKEALQLLGLADSPQGTLTSFSCSPHKISLGERLIFSCEYVSTAQTVQKISITYVLFYKNKKGYSEKVFSLFEGSVNPGEKKTFSKQHLFREMTTRTLYPGTHHIEIRAGGDVLCRESFELII
jgi:3-methyladenine DNA glycosylase AlkC